MMLFECAKAISDEDDIYRKVLSFKGIWLREEIKDYKTGNKRVKRYKKVSASSNISVPCTKLNCTNSKKKKPDCVWHMTESLLKDINDEAIGGKSKRELKIL